MVKKLCRGATNEEPLVTSYWWAATGEKPLTKSHRWRVFGHMPCREAWWEAIGEVPPWRSTEEFQVLVIKWSMVKLHNLVIYNKCYNMFLASRSSFSIAYCLPSKSLCSDSRQRAYVFLSTATSVMSLLSLIVSIIPPMPTGRPTAAYSCILDTALMWHFENLFSESPECALAYWNLFSWYNK